MSRIETIDFKSNRRLLVVGFAFVIAATLSGKAGQLLDSRSTHGARDDHPRTLTSSDLSGKRFVPAAANIFSTAAGGNWSNPATWAGGVVPTASDDVTIVDGATVTIDVTTAICLNLTVGQGTSGVLQYAATPASALTVDSNLTVAPGAVFAAGTGVLNTHVLNIGGSNSTSAAAGNLTVNGTFDMNTTAGVTTNFFGSSEGLLSGTGATADFFSLVGQKGTNQTATLDVTRVITLAAGTGSGSAGLHLSVVAGTIKISSATVATPWFGSQTLVAAAGRLWLNNASASLTVFGVGTGTGAGSPTINGTLRVEAGTFGYGSGNNTLTAGANAGVIIGGGSLNMFGAVSFANGSTFTMTAGNFNVDPQAATVLGASINAVRFNTMTVNFTGGTLTIVDPHAATGSGKELSISTTNSSVMNFQGGTIKFGDGTSSTAGSTDGFEIDTVVSSGQPFLGNVVIDNPATNTATRFVKVNNAAAPFQFLVGGNLTTTNSGGSEFRLNSNVVKVSGNVVNNGTIDGTTGASTLEFLGAGSTQTYAGSGTFAGPLSSLTINNALGVTVDSAAANIATLNLALVTGSLANTNRITLGNGGATSGTVQIGSGAGATAAGSFDVAPTFNLGTGGETVSYLRTTTARVTGPEINPARVLTNLTYDDNDLAHTLTVAGGDLTIAGAATLTNGRIITGTNTLAIDTAGTVTRTNGYVDGNLRKTFGTPSNKIFEVGTANGFSPVTVNATGRTFPSTFTVKATEGSHPSVNPATSIKRFWTLTETGDLTADLTFNYLDPQDIMGNEGNYSLMRISGGTPVAFPGTVDPSANTASLANVSEFSEWTVGEANAPTAVRLTRFDAVAYADGVQLHWQSGFEVNNLGYHLYRDQEAKRTQVTPALVAGSALSVGPGSRLTAGYSYSWFDQNGTADTAYYLQAIDLNGTRQWHGPVYPYSGVAAGISAKQHQRATLMRELSDRSDSYDATSEWPALAISQACQETPKSTAATLATQQLIAAGQAIKIKVNHTGWYRVTFGELLNAGLNPAADARLLQLYVDGCEVPLELSTNSGRFTAGDTLEFYGLALDTPTTDTRTYWLIVGNSPGKRIPARRSRQKSDNQNWTQVASANSFPSTTELQEKLLYASHVLNGDAENIFGAPVLSEPITQTLTVTNLDLESGAQAKLEIALQGLTSERHFVRVQLNGVDIGQLNLANAEHKTARFDINQGLLHNGENQVCLVALDGELDISLVDWMRLTYAHLYKADNNRLVFSLDAGQAARVSGFTTANVRVIDITDPLRPVEVATNSSPAQDSYGVIVTASNASRTFIAFTDDLALHPSALMANVPSNWNDSSNGADMLIIAHADFRRAIEPLAALRRSQGLTVSVVDVEDVYDEFSYGAHTPAAIKDFLISAAANWSRKPQYLLLVGDSTWDPRNYFGQGYKDFVPTRLIDTSYMETGSDDWLADFDNDGLPDMAVGRLPARSAADVNLMVNKILLYEQEREVNAPLRDVLMIADSGFELQNGQTQTVLPSNMNVHSINRAELASDELTRSEIVSALNLGPMIVNYYGHGSVAVWTGANLLDVDTAANLTNANGFSLYVMMTCLNGYSHDAYIDSLSEALLKAQKGGAVAVWASTGFTEAQPQFVMDLEFYRQAFGGQGVRLGQAIRTSKSAISDRDVRRTWILLGDPAMRLR